MHPIVISSSNAIAQSLVTFSSSVARIVQSNNWKDIELCKIAKMTELACEKIKLQSKCELADIEELYKYISMTLNSSKLNSSEKRQLFIDLMDVFERI